MNIYIYIYVRIVYCIYIISCTHHLLYYTCVHIIMISLIRYLSKIIQFIYSHRFTSHLFCTYALPLITVLKSTCDAERTAGTAFCNRVPHSSKMPCRMGSTYRRLLCGSQCRLVFQGVQPCVISGFQAFESLQPPLVS